MVIVDTSIWIDYFSGRPSRHAAALGNLVEADRAALVGVVLAELIRGMRTPKDRDDLDARLTGARFVEMSASAWRRAGSLAQGLDSRGLPMPMTDVFIAALALQESYEVFTRDKHFERIPGLRLYKPEGVADA